MGWGNSGIRSLGNPITGAWNAIRGGAGSLWHSIGGSLQHTTPATSQARELPGYSNGLPINYFKIAQGMAQAQYGPQRQLLADQIANLNRQMQTGSLPELQQYPLEQGHLNANYGLDTRELDLKDQNIGLERQDIAATAGMNTAQISLAEQMRALLDPEYEQQKADIAREAATGRRKTTSGAIGRGALGSEGFSGDISDINLGEQSAMKNAEIGFNRNAMQGDYAIAEAKDRKRQTEQRNSRLDLEAKQLGVDRDRLKENLDYGLKRLGLDKQITWQKLTDMLNSKRLEDQVLAQNIFKQALQYAPVLQGMPTLPPALVKQYG